MTPTSTPTPTREYPDVSGGPPGPARNRRRIGLVIATVCGLILLAVLALAFSLRSGGSKNPQTWAAFIAQRPTTPQNYDFVAKLGQYYNYDFLGKEGRYYSIALFSRDRHDLQHYGYIAKSSGDGEHLFRLLKDGRAHEVTGTLRFLEGGKGNVLVIDCVESKERPCYASLLQSTVDKLLVAGLPAESAARHTAQVNKALAKHEGTRLDRLQREHAHRLKEVLGTSDLRASEAWDFVLRTEDGRISALVALMFAPDGRGQANFDHIASEMSDPVRKRMVARAEEIAKQIRSKEIDSEVLAALGERLAQFADPKQISPMMEAFRMQHLLLKKLYTEERLGGA